MSLTKGPTEGGNGGRRGHSNMEHWGFTDEVKLAAKKRRRLESKKLAYDARTDSQAPQNADEGNWHNAMQRTQLGHCGCNSRVLRVRSLSLGR